MTSQLFFDPQSSVFLASLLPSRGETVLKIAVSYYNNTIFAIFFMPICKNDAN